MSIVPLVDSSISAGNVSGVTEAKTKPRRSVITPEHKEEARRLMAIWESRQPLLAESGLNSQERFGIEYGIGTQGAVWQFLHGHTPLSLAAAAAFARGLSCSVADFSPRLFEELRSYGVPWFSPDVQDLLRGLSPDGLARIEAVIRALLTPSSEPPEAGNLKPN
jgi:hypothetical protein